MSGEIGRVVLGIDAAWTASNASGIALTAEVYGKWRLLAVAPSYAAFVSPADPPRHAGSLQINAGVLLDIAERRVGKAVDLIAVDMPLALTPIRGRRASDNEVSRAYGARWCSTHTPSVARPGPIGEALCNAFAVLGYPLVTRKVVGPSLVEVYPHPALVELAQANRRLAYKAQKVASYWPDRKPEDRRRALLEIWEQIVDRLEREIEGTRSLLPPIVTTDRAIALKAYEDMLDAVVCAWVGIMVLKGKALPYGDADSAIWIPEPTCIRCEISR